MKAYVSSTFDDLKGDPEVRALLLDHAASDSEINVRKAVWAALLREWEDRYSSTSSLIGFASGAQWNRQIAVRIFSCTAEFTPDRLPVLLRTRRGGQDDPEESSP